MNSQGEVKSQGTAGGGQPAPAPHGHATGLRLGGRYLLGDLIGRGAAAAVYEGHDESLGREVAVKLFRSEATDQSTGRDGGVGRQLSEVGVLAGLEHPNLVPIFDAGTDTSEQHPRTFVVMELVLGTDLHRVLQRAQVSDSPGPSADEAALLGAGVADALAYIHSQGIVHRDVKPANILLHRTADWAQRPKLTDFGVARLMEDAGSTTSGQPMGTAAYFSPEQAQGLSTTPASDVYSLGLVLLECLTGQVEFPGPAVASAAARIQRDPNIPSTFGSGWQQLLTAMTERDPKARPAAEVVADILRSGPSPDALQTGRLNTVPAAPAAKESGASAATEAISTGGPPTSRTPAVAAPQLQVPDDDAPAPQRDPRAGPRPWVLVAAAALAALVAIGLIAMVFFFVSAGPNQIDYPSVPGQLGEQLEELQEGVAP